MSDKTIKIMLMGIICLIVLLTVFGVFLLAFFNGAEEAPAFDQTVSQKDKSAEYNQNYFTPNSSLSQENGEETTSESDKIYRVQEYQGKVAVFRENEEVPCLETDINVSNLTELDREYLQKGIVARSSAELLNILEDYDY